ncbi:HAMP domain-containing sensor histidine kinase [Kiritimatiellota bacterium B12222]|nr:HAMP domain-containing sensor histidine kinase [Kiritimatiellota bacterium B12222]
MRSHPRRFPVWFFTILVILPVLVLAGVGMKMLFLEQQRLQEQTLSVHERSLEQSAERLRERMERLRDELIFQLQSLPASAKDEALMELQRSHPLVRNVFRVSEDGKVLLPKLGIYLDPETEQFLSRYEALFADRVEWFPPQAETKSFSRYKRAPPELLSEWRPWQWADRDSLLLYVSVGGQAEVVGVEIEMSALYARIDVWLRSLSISAGGVDLALLDRRDRVLVATGETENRSGELSTEMGALLPYARLAMYPQAPLEEGLSDAFLYVAGSLGLMLILCILGGTFGLTAWVNRSRKEALQKTSFVSNVSHEFKTPLTTLRLYSELLLEGRVKDPEKQKHYLQTMRNESERLARLVHNVLDFSRLEMGRSRLQAVPLCVNDHLLAVVERVQERFTELGMCVCLPEEQGWGFADPDAVEQVMLNLFDNAMKYASEGGVLRIKIQKSGDHLAVSFEDEGPGIPPSEQTKIFNAFHQVDMSITRESGGTGLGLHISRRLAREMNGDLSCHSDKTGCIFVWRIPVPPEEKS